MEQITITKETVEEVTSAIGRYNVELFIFNNATKIGSNVAESYNGDLGKSVPHKTVRTYDWDLEVDFGSDYTVRDAIEEEVEILAAEMSKQAELDED